MDDKNVTTTEPLLAEPPSYFSDEAKPQAQPEDPDMNTIYLSIFTMLFCCWPCGLVGLIYGIQGMQQHYRGQYVSADRTTKSAKKWTICGIVSGVTFICVVFFFIIVGNALGYCLGYGHNRDN